jgi:hypothetical protein
LKLSAAPVAAPILSMGSAMLSPAIAIVFRKSLLVVISFSPSYFV